MRIFSQAELGAQHVPERVAVQFRSRERMRLNISSGCLPSIKSMKAFGILLLLIFNFKPTALAVEEQVNQKLKDYKLFPPLRY